MTGRAGLPAGVPLVVALVLAALVSVPGCGAGHRMDVDSRGGGGAPEEVTPDGAWCWFADPRAVSFEGERSRTYTGWTDSTGRVWAASIDHATGRVESTFVRGYGGADDHANPAVIVRPTGHVSLFYSAHGGREIEYVVSLRPEDVGGWSAPRSLAPGDGQSAHGFTYPNPVLLPGEDDRLYLFYRNRWMKPAFVRTEPTGAWSGEHVLVEGDVDDAYLKCAGDGESVIHLAFTDGHPRGRPHNSLRYAAYSGDAFRRADGTPICELAELPFRAEDADLVYDAVEGGARSWVWDVAVDPEGRPVIVYAVFPRKSDHRYRYARWDGTSWSDHEIVSAGGWFPDTPPGEEEKEFYYSAGATLDHDDPSVVYLSRRIRGAFEIERWETPDGGATWRTEAVTSESALDNVRPVVPRSRVPGGVHVLWMAGPYVSYTDFGTSIRMLRD